MFNILQTVSVLRDVEAVIASPHFTAEERADLIEACLQSLTDRTPHGRIVIDAIRRAYPAPEKQRREAEGEQDAPEVAEGTDEAAQGETQGQQEQAEDAGRLPEPVDSDRASATPAPKAKGRASKARLGK